MRLFATSVVALSLACLFAVSAPASSAHAEAPKQTKQPVIHTVIEGDTLDKIAQANNTNYLRLFYANTDIVNPDLIQVDQKVRIPSADEKLAERSLPSAAPAPTAAPVVASPQAVAAPAPQRVVTSSAPAIASGSVWDALAQCESGGNWAINTGNGFYGGIQFTLSSWAAVGGSGMPNQASREEQIMRGQMLQAKQGWGAWPACAAKLGLL
jgi:murein DD-endopeptidase MepM/ murein hydrolase activator NlpD